MCPSWKLATILFSTTSGVNFSKCCSILLLLLSHQVVRNFLWPYGLQHARLSSLTISWSLPKFISIESVMLSNHLILCNLLFLPSIFPGIRVFSNESVVLLVWPNIGASASASVLPESIQGWFPLKLTCLISLISKGLSRVFSSTTVRKCYFFGTLPSLLSNSHVHTWLLERP